MFDNNNDPETLEALATFIKLAAKRARERPRTISDVLARQAKDDFALMVGVDGAACRAGCGGADGVAVLVTERRIDGLESDVPASHRIGIVAFDHDRGVQLASLSAEQAKELVNRLGEAITVAERVDGTLPA